MEPHEEELVDQQQDTVILPHELFGDAFDGDYLRSDHFAFDDHKLVSVKISTITPPNKERDKKNKLIDRPIIGFAGKDKRLILNMTNFRCIGNMFGWDARKWIGKEIRIQRRYVYFGKRLTMGLRIIPPSWDGIHDSVQNQSGFVTVEEALKSKRRS